MHHHGKQPPERNRWTCLGYEMPTNAIFSVFMCTIIYIIHASNSNLAKVRKLLVVNSPKYFKRAMFLTLQNLQLVKKKCVVLHVT